MNGALVPLFHEFRETIGVCVVRCQWYDWAAAVGFLVVIFAIVRSLGRGLAAPERDENT